MVQVENWILDLLQYWTPLPFTSEICNCSLEDILRRIIPILDTIFGLEIQQICSQIGESHNYLSWPTVYINPRDRAQRGSSFDSLVSWGSEVIPPATPFFKRAYKISHPPRLWVSWIDLPSFASSSKIWPNFSKKVFFSWSYEKVILTKNVRLTYYSSMKKKSERFGWFLT